MKFHLVLVQFIFVLIISSIMPISAYSLEMEFTDLNGQQQEYSNFEGKPLLVDAFATWCEPCKIEILNLIEMLKVLDNKVEFFTLSISPQTDDVEKVKEFRNEFSANWTFGIDTNLVFSDTFNTFVIPTLYLFDSDGNLIDLWEGITDPNIVLDTMETELNIEADRVDDNLLGNLELQLVGNNLFQISTSFLAVTFTYMLLVPSKAVKIV